MSSSYLCCRTWQHGVSKAIGMRLELMLQAANRLQDCATCLNTDGILEQPELQSELL